MMMDQPTWRIETKPLPPAIPARLPKTLMKKLKEILAENRVKGIDDEITIHQLWDLISDFLVDLNK